MPVLIGGLKGEGGGKEGGEGGEVALGGVGWVATENGELRAEFEQALAASATRGDGASSTDYHRQKLSVAGSDSLRDGIAFRAQ